MKWKKKIKLAYVLCLFTVMAVTAIPLLIMAKGIMVVTSSLLPHDKPKPEDAPWLYRMSKALTDFYDEYLHIG